MQIGAEDSVLLTRCSGPFIDVRHKLVIETSVKSIGYTSLDYSILRAIRPISGVTSLQIAPVVSNAHAIKFNPAALHLSA
jgi:hypothetical protein